MQHKPLDPALVSVVVKARTSQHLKALVIATFCVTAAIITSLAQQKAIGVFDSQSDVGKVNKPSAARYDAEKDEYTIEGSGANMWADHDDFHFLWKRMQWNFILTARAGLIGKGVEPHRKIGWIARSSLDSDPAHVSAVVHGDGLTALQFRRAKGVMTEEVKSSLTAADIVQLERKGSTFIMSVARFGEPFVREQ